MQKPVLYPPRGVDGWVEQLKDFSLPILPSMGRRLREQMAKKDVSFFEIAKDASQSPVISFNLIHKANQQGAKVTRVDHAISLLGIEQTQRLINQMPMLQLKPQHLPHRYYFQGVSISSFAAVLARNWATKLHFNQVNDLFWSTLLCGVPWWYLSYFAGLETQLIDYLVENQRIHCTKAEPLILGCSVNQLAQGLAAHWRFPELTMQALQLMGRLQAKDWSFLLHPQRVKQPSAEQREWLSLFYSPVMTLVLANWLSRCIDKGWHDSTTRHVLALAARHLKMEPAACYQLVQRSALEFAHNFKFPLVEMPISRLLWTTHVRSMVAKPEFIKYSQYLKKKAEQVEQPKSIDVKQTQVKATVPTPDKVQMAKSKAEVNLEEKAETKAQLIQTPVKAPATTAVVSNVKSNIPVSVSEPSTASVVAQVSSLPAPSQLSAVEDTVAVPDTVKHEVVNAAKSEPVRQREMIPPSENHDLPFAKPKKFVSARASDHMLFKKVLSTLSHPNKLSSLQEGVQEITNGMVFGIGFDRAIIALVNLQQKRLEPIYRQGVDSFDQMDFDVSFHEAPLFEKVLMQDKAVYVNPQASKKVCAILPPMLVDWLDPNDFAMATLVCHHKPVAWIFVDKKYSQERITQADFHLFKHLNKAASQCFSLQNKLLSV